MPGLALNFINIATDSRLTSVASGSRFTSRLQEALAFIGNLAQNPTGEGTIWFPPGQYLVNTGLVIPETVTIAFGPGALLVPVVAGGTHPSLADTSIQIFGQVDAGVHAIFATIASPPFGIAETIAIGRIVFMGTRTPRVLPELYGAHISRSPRQTRVLELWRSPRGIRTLRACSRHPMPPTSTPTRPFATAISTING